MAGVKEEVVVRADQVSAEFFQAFKEKMASRRRSALPLVALADFSWLMRVARGDGQTEEEGSAITKNVALGRQLEVIRAAVKTYDITA